MTLALFTDDQPGMRYGTRGCDAIPALTDHSCRCLQDTDMASGRGRR